MQIAYISDIHDEYRKIGFLPRTPCPPNLKLIILAGDITNNKQIIDYLYRTQKEWRLPLLFVPGNHEYYEEDIDEFTITLLKHFRTDENIHILANKSIVIEDVAFHGTTLWTGFDSFGNDMEANKKAALMNIFDFYAIRNGSKFITPEDMLNKYILARAFLLNSLKSTSAGGHVVISHFPPSQILNQCNDTDALSAYFYANCDDLIDELQPKLWIYGHSHCTVSTKIGTTDIRSFQPGYPYENSNSEGLGPEYFELSI